jgi:hypothetical protein
MPREEGGNSGDHAEQTREAAVLECEKQSTGEINQRQKQSREDVL